MTLLPTDQVDALIDAVTEALDLAHQGRTADGYTILLEGCACAQEASAGQEWEARCAKPRRCFEAMPCTRLTFRS
jgi:hypothetical protein